jgi:glycosyltransferase 2 family protein
MKKPLRGHGASTLVRVAVSVALLVLLFRQVEPGRVLDHLRALSPFFILFAAAYYAACQFLSSYRWQLFLSAKNISVPVSALFSYYLIGMFWNRFLPGAVGGDAAKAYHLYRRIGHGNIALSSVFLERFVGLLGLAILAVCALIVGLDRVIQPVVLITVGGSTLLFVFVILLLWWKPLFARVHKLMGRLLPAWLAGRIQALYGALSSYGDHPATLVWATLLSVALQALYALYFGVVAWGLNIDIDVYYFVLFQPPVTLAMLAPISLGGLGVREVVLVVLFREVGVAAADVLAVSLTGFLLTIPLSLWGGLLLVWQRRTAAVPGAGELS